jgi:type I restriction enzyme S subunit
MYTNAPSRYAKKGDILMSVRAPVGATNIANNDCCIGRGLAALNSKIGSITHLYQIIQDLKAKFDLLNNGGTTFGAINKDELHTLVVVVPDNSVLENFEEIASPIFEKQMKLGYETEELQSLRDFFLPILLNGQATIKD